MARAESGPSTTSWDQQAIVAEIRRRGSTISQLSRDNSLARGTLQGVFYRRYPRGQTIVANFIGRAKHELWPQWYGEDDKLLPLAGGIHVVQKRAA